MTVEDLGKSYKQKFPQYSKFSDKDVGLKVMEKYPVYAKSVTDTPSVSKISPEQRKTQIDEYKKEADKSTQEAKIAEENLKPENLLRDVPSGIIKGAGDTLNWMSGLGQDVINKTIGKIIGAKEQPIAQIPGTEAKTPGEEIGKTLEQGLEFLIPMPGGAKAKAASKIAEETSNLVGKITQASSPKDIEIATKVLGMIETKGIKTAEELSSVLDTKTKVFLKEADKAYSAAKTALKPEALIQSFGEGANKVSKNFVSTALNDLDKLYGKIAEPKNQAKIRQIVIKYVNEGLTPQEINNLAKEYGTELGKKAFGKNGEPLMNFTAQGIENVRTGLKETARKFLPDKTAKTAEILDKKANSLIKTKKMVDKFAKSVQNSENKLREAGILGKVGEAVGTAIDISTGGLVKAIFRKVLQGEGAGKMESIEIERNFAKYLKKLETIANPDKSAEYFKKAVVVLKDIFQDLGVQP